MKLWVQGEDESPCLTPTFYTDYCLHVTGTKSRAGHFIPFRSLDLGLTHCKLFLEDQDAMDYDDVSMRKLNNLVSGGGWVLKNDEGEPCLPMSLYGGFADQLASWLDTEFLRSGVYMGFKPIFAFHNVILRKVKENYAPGGIELMTVDRSEPTSIGFLGFSYETKKGGYIFVSGTINKKVPMKKNSYNRD